VFEGVQATTTLTQGGVVVVDGDGDGDGKPYARL
jgi:hypothetical protein